MEHVAEALSKLPTTGFLVIEGDRTVLDLGDNSSPVYLASVRKSVLPVLFGRSVANGVIPLDATLDELGIDDVGGLPVEREARVRDLLTSSDAPAGRSSTRWARIWRSRWGFRTSTAGGSDCSAAPTDRCIWPTTSSCPGVTWAGSGE